MFNTLKTINTIKTYNTLNTWNVMDTLNTMNTLMNTYVRINEEAERATHYLDESTEPRIVEVLT